MKFTEEKLEMTKAMFNGQLIMVNESVELSSFLHQKPDKFQNVQFFY